MKQKDMQLQFLICWFNYFFFIYDSVEFMIVFQGSEFVVDGFFMFRNC